MPKFQVEIEEISQRVEEIEAKDLEEALEIAEEKYDSNEIELDYDDFKGHEVREYRPNVMEEDLVQNAIFNINCGRAILLEGNKNIALIKRIDVRDDITPYIIVNNLKVNKYETGFEWDQGRYFNSLVVASEEYEKDKGLYDYNDLIYSELGEATLENYDIQKLEDIDDVIKDIFEEDMSREEFLSMLTDKIKEQLISNYMSDTVRREKDSYYFATDICFIEDEINKRAFKIDEILSDLNINNVKPYDVIELLEQNNNGEINEELSEKITANIKICGYEKSINSFIEYINEELEKEETEEVEEEEL